MATFELQFPAEQIGDLERRYSYEDDSRCRAAGAAARARGHYTRGEFLTVCSWKTIRSGPTVAANTEDAVRAATTSAFAATDERSRMDTMLSLEGVGVPTASALLCFAFPDGDPILDVRALASLGVKGKTQYRVSFWLEYLDACRTLARRHGVSLRTLDKALWQYSKDRAG